MTLRRTLALLLMLLLTLVPLSSALAEGDDTDQQVTIQIGGNTPEDQRTQEEDVGNVTFVTDGGEAAVQVDVRVSGQGTIRAEDVSSTATVWYNALAVQVDAQGQEARAIVEAGDISAVAEQETATGVQMTAIGEGAEASVTVKTVSSTAERAEAGGVYIYAENGGQAQVQVTGEGGIVARGEWADGLYAEIRGVDTQAQVEVAGDIVAVTEYDPEGVRLFVVEGGQGEFTCGGDVSAQGPGALGIFAGAVGLGAPTEITMAVAGDVSAQGERATGAVLYTDSQSDAVSLTVGGDLAGDATGLDVSVSGGVVDILVEGTISGGDQAILVSGAGADEGLTLTAWKVEGETLVKAQNGADAEPIQNGIQYIIKTEQPEQGGVFALNGVRSYLDFSVAHAGDTVTLLPELSEGYTLLGAYNNGASLLQNEEGSYYLVVPAGGGVLLSIELGEYPPLNVPPQPPVRVTGTAATADGGASVVFCSNQVLHMMAGEENIRGYFYSYEARLCFRIGSEDAAYTEHEDGSGTLTAGGFTFELSPALVLALKVECYS